MDGLEYGRLARALIDQKDDLMNEWDWLSKRILPRSRDVLRQLKAPASDFRREHCSKACDALHTLVGAFITHVTPSGQKWFEFEDKSIKKSEQYENWYRHATDVTLDSLAASNFYTSLQEMHMDRCLFGTGCLLCESKEGGGLSFKHIPIGSYGIAENKDGSVDTVCRSFKYTARQAVQAWGVMRLPVEVRQAYDRPERRFTEEFEFLHLVMPRKGYTLGNGKSDVDPKKMRFASIYLYNGGDMPIIDEGGYPEFPYLVSRFLKWDSVWGYPPGRKCRDELEASVRAERNLDALGDLAVYPRVFIDAEQDGDIDYRSGGQTVIDRNVAGTNLPREWGTSGRYDVGVERVERAERKIESAFFVPFLQVVSNVDRQMTATEVIARQKEQVIGISATFSQFVYDFNAFMLRMFAELYRQGVFNTSSATQPKELIVKAEDGIDYSVTVPGVSYKGVISQSIEMAQRQSMDYAMQTAAQYIQFTGDPSAMDCIDMSKAIKFLFKVSAAPDEIYRNKTEIEQVQTDRRNAQQQQLELMASQAANQQSQATRNVSE
ncbi:portal protein [Akkermansia sp.]|uniref:portal protein n=1 Tax=Akkermansia sp. TaxID=1872421 RepID=UPI0025BDAF22|nr:portal protein [Akkermansia sp.]MCD8063972.1 portal protein [Akkermansia sp.]